MNIVEKIRKFLGKFLDISELKNDDNIFEKGLVDSLFAMQLVNFVENEFNISVANEQLNLVNFKDVNSIEALIKLNTQN